MARLGRLPFCRIWPQETGVARALSTDQVVSFGVKGGGDLSGLLAPDGRRLEVEIKTGKARQSKQQRRFEAMLTRFGGLYLLVSSLAQEGEDAAVDNAIAHVTAEVKKRGWSE